MNQNSSSLSLLSMRSDIPENRGDKGWLATHMPCAHLPSSSVLSLCHLRGNSYRERRYWFPWFCSASSWSTVEQAAARVSAVALLDRDSLSRQRVTCWQIINILNPETVLFLEERVPGSWDSPTVKFSKPLHSQGIPDGALAERKYSGRGRSYPFTHKCRDGTKAMFSSGVPFLPQGMPGDCLCHYSWSGWRRRLALVGRGQACAKHPPMQRAP